MGAWQGDWAARIVGFAEREGYGHIWEYLRAHPGVPLTDIARAVGDAAAIQVQGLSVDYCLARHEMHQLVCDLMARCIRESLPRGWGEGSEYDRVRAVTSIGGLPEPYSVVALEMGRRLLREAAPSKGWLPSSGDDEALRSAYGLAVESLSDEQRAFIDRGEVEPRPGDAYWARVGPVWKTVSIYDGGATFLRQFEQMDARIGALFAAHWCQSEVRNGGFQQFFSNPTGVLAPEAVAGFADIGLAGCSDLVAQAMRFFGPLYPREQLDRQRQLTAVTESERANGRPFAELDRRFFELIRDEAGGFAAAADRYCTTIPVAHRQE